MSRFTALSLPAILVAASAALAQEPVVRTYSLHDLLAPVPESFLVPVGPALPTETVGEHGNSGGRRIRQPHRRMRLDDEALMNWLKEAWGGDASAGGDLAGHVLTLRATPGTHAKVQDLLGVLQGVMGRTVELSIHVLPPAAAARDSAVLDAPAIEALLATHPPLRSYGMDLRSDVPAMLENGRAVNMLRDYDVEVAKRSNISDPKTDVVFLGDRMGAVATPMADGRFSLRWGWSVSHGELPFPRRPLTGKGLGTMDLPVVDSAQVLGTAVLSKGDGVLVGGAKEAFLIVLEEAGAAAPRTGSVSAVPLGPLAIPPLWPVPKTLLVRRPGMEDPLFGWSRDYDLPDIYASLSMYLGTEVGEHLDFTVLGSHAIVTSQGLAERVEILARQQAETVATHGLLFRVGTLPRTGAEGNADDLAAQLDAGSSVVTLTDQAFLFESWTERAFVRDYDVEIAERSAVANPVVGITLDGWSVRGIVHRTAAGLPSLSGSFQWSNVPAIEPRDTGIQEIGSIDFPEVRYTETDLRAALRPGSWQVLHRGPDPAAPDERVLVLVVRAEHR